MMKLPPPLPPESNHSFSRGQVSTGLRVRIARAEHEYTTFRESMVSDWRIKDLVQCDMITPAQGTLAQARNIIVAWENYNAMQALIAEQRQSDVEAALRIVSEL